MERNAQHNEHNIFGQIVPGKTPKGKPVLQMRKYIKLQQIKRYKIPCLSLAELRQPPNFSC